MKYKLIDNIEYWGSGGIDILQTVQMVIISVDEQISADSTDVGYLCWQIIFFKLL